jgi:hypothetical protein
MPALQPQPAVRRDGGQFVDLLGPVDPDCVVAADPMWMPSRTRGIPAALKRWLRADLG